MPGGRALGGRRTSWDPGGGAPQAVLGRQGCSEAKSVALSVLEHWALRSEGLAAGPGALQRLLWAAQEAANRKAE